MQAVVQELVDEHQLHLKLLPEMDVQLVQWIVEQLDLQAHLLLLPLDVPVYVVKPVLGLLPEHINVNNHALFVRRESRNFEPQVRKLLVFPRQQFAESDHFILPQVVLQHVPQQVSVVNLEL